MLHIVFFMLHTQLKGIIVSISMLRQDEEMDS